MHHEDFQTWTAWDEIRKMQCIAMAETSGVRQSAVVIDGRSTIDNFIFAILIHIAHGQAVRALTSSRAIATAIAIEGPTTSQLAVAPVPRDQYRAGVIAACHHQTGTS